MSAKITDVLKPCVGKLTLNVKVEVLFCPHHCVHGSAVVQKGKISFSCASPFAIPLSPVWISSACSACRTKQPHLTRQQGKVPDPTACVHIKTAPGWPNQFVTHFLQRSCVCFCNGFKSLIILAWYRNKAKSQIRLNWFNGCFWFKETALVWGLAESGSLLHASTLWPRGTMGFSLLPTDSSLVWVTSVFSLGDASPGHMEVMTGGLLPFHMILTTEKNSKREEEGMWN